MLLTGSIIAVVVAAADDDVVMEKREKKRVSFNTLPYTATHADLRATMSRMVGWRRRKAGMEELAQHGTQ